MSTDPFLVAAYAKDMDCVTVIEFPNELAKRHQLTTGSRLIAIIVYNERKGNSSELVPDLIEGPLDDHRFNNFHPLIAEFISDESGKIETRKAEIVEPEWDRCYDMGLQWLDTFPNQFRLGKPNYSWYPREQLNGMPESEWKFGRL